MRVRIIILVLSLFVALSDMSAADKAQHEILPVTGSWINLYYQDVRNKYTNPEIMDNTDPEMWRQKVRDMHEIGVDYLVFMAVANEGKADYPSSIMPRGYQASKTSPVSAIMETADSLGMKVFLSIGWAFSQDDNIRDKKILNRQIAIMQELAAIYKDNKSFYGWYLPVEDCLGPVLSEHAVKAVNALVDKAHKLTPDKKTMISPYGIFNSDFDNPKYAEQLGKLRVDIINYQDEVGCVREEFPMSRLKNNWMRLKAIHEKTGTEIWANCELFTWEKGLNSRESALIPAAMPRVMSQFAAATKAGASCITSFMVNGVWDANKSAYWLGQPHWSKIALEDYLTWQRGEAKWKLLEASFMGTLKKGVSLNEIMTNGNEHLFDGALGEENIGDETWKSFNAGKNEILVKFKQNTNIENVFIRMLDCNKRGVKLPSKIYLYISEDGRSYDLKAVKDSPYFGNNLHDTWIDGVIMECKSINAKSMKIVLDCEKEAKIDEVFINPSIEK